MTAARLHHRVGIDYQLVEARDRLGGWILSAACLLTEPKQQESGVLKGNPTAGVQLARLFLGPHSSDGQFRPHQLSPCAGSDSECAAPICHPNGATWDAESTTRYPRRIEGPARHDVGWN